MPFPPKPLRGAKIAFLKTPLFDELMRLGCFTPGHRAPGLGRLRFVVLRVADFSHRVVAGRVYAVQEPADNRQRRVFLCLVCVFCCCSCKGLTVGGTRDWGEEMEGWEVRVHWAMCFLGSGEALDVTGIEVLQQPLETRTHFQVKKLRVGEVK